MRMVSQAKLKIKGGGPNGQQKFITYPMEMPVSHSIYTEIQKKNSVWKIKRRCEGNHNYIKLKSDRRNDKELQNSG